MSTYTPIASQTLGSTAASVTFSSIPQGYTDIVLVAQATSSGEVFMRFDGDTGANYSGTEIWTGGSGVNSQRASNENYITLRDFSTTLGNNMSVVNIMNYSNSTTNKTVLIRTNDNRYSRVYARVALWRNTSAINEITLFNSSGTFASGSTFSLYGIQVGDKAQKAQGGNIVTSDGTYVYHTFTSSGAFIPNEALTVDYLVVAGGGGTPTNSGGGGGGGYRTSIGGSTLSLTAKTYPVVVGAGGANTGTNGSNSVFATITSTGGGAGGGSDANGSNGGSGGGGGMWTGVGTPALSGGSGNAGSYSPSEGNNGGAGSRSSNSPAGGGGGANATGANGASGQAGNGGAGTANSISGTSVTYAGGGGGSSYNSSFVTPGTGGAGGGGNGVASINTASGNNGTVNTGGGAGGGGNTTGAAGGSGIVIIRYAV